MFDRVTLAHLLTIRPSFGVGDGYYDSKDIIQTEAQLTGVLVQRLEYMAKKYAASHSQDISISSTDFEHNSFERFNGNIDLSE